MNETGAGGGVQATSSKPIRPAQLARTAPRSRTSGHAQRCLGTPLTTRRDVHQAWKSVQRIIGIA